MLARRTELPRAPTVAAVAAVAVVQAAAALLLLGVLVVLDRGLPHAGLLVLLILVGTVGTAHGVLDTLLILQHLPTQPSRWLVAAVYLLAALLTVALLQGSPAVALMVLLGLSLWHFGEHFEGTTLGSKQPSPVQQRIARVMTGLITRLVRGGAPVLMPALVAQTALAPQAQVAAGGDPAATAMLWMVWTGMAYAWAALLGVWCLLSLAAQTSPKSPGSLTRLLAPQGTAPSRRRLLLEVLAIAVLYVLLSPLMAFALYFGAYHATGHIRRVLRNTPKGVTTHWRSDWRLWCTLALSLILGAALAAWMLPQASTFALPDVALRTVILALAAVSVPHVVLIGWWAQGLRARPAPGA
jgi:beta-carotene 15,15'-dioxygenase